MSDWLPLSSFFEMEVDGPCVHLLTVSGEVRGYWCPDDCCWYREGEGADLESAPLVPTHWRPIAW
jgi:hypothetical protein